MVTAGGAVDVRPWLDNVSALLAVWYPGQQGGAALADLLRTYNVPAPAAFKKIVSGRRLWNFDKKELDIWKVAL